jgi:hypothetical protein
VIQTAAYIYSFFIVIIILFHLGLVLGRPWGRITMGGQHLGKLPKNMRLVAFAAIFLLIFFLFNVLSQSCLMFTEWQFLTSKTIWIVVVFNFMTLIGNLITKSKWERIIWAPVAAVMFSCVILLIIFGPQ